jgi:tetratricopeptide (TPR) repeat protein
MDKRELLDIYEARGGEDVYEQARPLYEAALAEHPGDAVVQRDYGYLLECHGRRMLEAAARAYERAIELDPRSEKARFQLIHAQAALGRHDEEVARYEGSSQHRLLAYAHVAARDWAAAERVVEDGLALAPADAILFELRGEVLAATGRPEEALAAWQRALDLDPEAISGHYSRAFLLEREGRRAEAAAEWRAIIDWSLARVNELDAEWPRRELARLEAQL